MKTSRNYDTCSYDPILKTFTRMDRFAEKYYSTSQYAYALNNPVSYIDPTGDTVVISGKASEQALKELQLSLQKQLNVAMNAKGKVTATIKDGVKRLSSRSKQAMKAFNDATITVNIIAENTKDVSTGGLYVGGAFMGNTVNGDGTVTARQEVNPFVLKILSDAYNVPGQGMLHEVTEAYQGAVASQKTGKSANAAFMNKPSPEYLNAHYRAVPQPGEINLIRYDLWGNKIPDGVSREVLSAEWVTTHIKPIKIMTYP